MRWLMLAAAAALLPAAAAAQFYDLDGTYRCVTAGNGACDKSAGAASAKPAQQKAEPLAPSLNEAIERVKRGAATPQDAALIEERAAANDPRAVEVLAWCKLNGIAMPADPVGAYFLYGDAARLGVANAKANQRAVFETRLSSAERQQVLLKENAR